MSLSPDELAKRPRVLILGAGFGGLTAARALRKIPVRVAVVDRSNHHLFQPLLYQVATAALNTGDIASPIRRILRGQENVEVFMAEARSIDLNGSRVELVDGEITYDYLILAVGAVDSYFGNESWRALAPGLKSLNNALDIRRRILSAFESAEREQDEERRRSWLTFVVVGGGATGVELAGTLSEVAQKTLSKDFHHIDPRQARILLVEGSERTLPGFVPELSASAQRQLEQLGVEVRNSSRVTDIDEQGVTVGGDRIECRTVLWAAGVEASPLTKGLGVPLDKSGRILVATDLTIPGHPKVFAIGDLVHLEQAGKLVPGVAPAAMQMGKHAVACIKADLASKPRKPFRYSDKGSLATIGRRKAVADLGKLKFSGTIAWLLWAGIHVFFLIGFRNRFLVMVEWAFSYFTFDRGARLITGPSHRAATDEADPRNPESSIWVKTTTSPNA